jgi:hypothetical protein
MTDEEQRKATQKLVLSRSPLTFWHKLAGRLPSSYRQLDAAVDALSERVLDQDPTDVPPDVRQLAERVRWAVLTLR